MKLLLSAIAALVVLAVPGLASAATYTWVGPGGCTSPCPGGGDWTVAANWSPAGVPGSADTAVLTGNNGGAGTSMAVTNASGSVAGLMMSGNSSLAVNGTLSISSGTVSWAAGSLSAGILSLGPAVSMTITNLDGGGGELDNAGTVTWNGTIYGDNGTKIRNSGTWNMTAGATSFSYIAGTDTADFYNTGTMNVAGSGNTNDTTGYWGFHNAGVVNFTGGGTLEWQNAGNTLSTLDDGGSVTGNGTLLFDQNSVPSNVTLNGTTTIGTGATLELGVGSLATVGATGATLTGSGSLLWTGGHIIGQGNYKTQPPLNWGSDLAVHMTGGALKDSSSTYIVSAAHVTWDAGEYGVGGAYFTNNGTFTVNGDLTIGGGYYSTFENHGTFIKASGSGQLTVNYLGFDNYGTINGASGTIYIVSENNGYTNTLEAGSTLSGSILSTAEVTLAGTSSLAAGATVEIGNVSPNTGILDGSGILNGTGTLKIDGSTIDSEMGTNLTLNCDVTLSTNTAATDLIINGGAITFGGATTWSGGTLNIGGVIGNRGTMTATASVTSTGTDTAGISNSGTFIADPGAGNVVTIGVLMTSSGSLTAKSGTLFFSSGQRPSLVQTAGTMTLAGGTLVSGDALTLQSGDAGVDYHDFYSIDIQGGTLTGSGIIDTVVTNEGTVAPGSASAAGTLTITQTYTQSAAGTLAIGLGGTTAGTGYDVLAVGGDATIAGTLTVSRIGSYIPTVSDTYTVLTSTGTDTPSVIGTFTTVNDPTGVTLTTTYNPANVVLGVTAVTIVPSDDAGADGGMTSGDASASDGGSKDAASTTHDGGVKHPDGGNTQGDSGSGNAGDGGAGTGSSGGCSAAAASAPSVDVWLAAMGVLIALGLRRSRMRAGL